MSTATENKVDHQAKISEKVKDIGQRFIEAVAIDHTTGAYTPPKDFYYTEGERAGYDRATLDGVAKFNDDFRCGTAWGFGQSSIQQFQEHKSLEQTVAQVPTFPNGSMTLSMPREFHGRAPGSTETIVSHGRLNVDWNSGAGKNGEMGHVLRALKQIGSESLGG